VRPSRNVIEQTWLAYALDEGREPSRVAAGLERVGEHYSGLIADRMLHDERRDERTGLLLWHREDARLRWPLWVESTELAAAATAVPTGWRRVVGEVPAEQAPRRLAQALASAPERASELNPPFVIGVRDREGLTIVNDFLGAGRLYEMRFDGGWVWSNRLGALPLFAGVAPRADADAWAVFAAAGWFLGEATPILGASKVPPGTAIRVRSGSGGVDVEHVETGAVRRAVEPRRARFGDSAAAAADQVRGMASDLGEAWVGPIAISLTGGRDSRVSAAGALGAGIEATFNTGDQVPGEVDVVHELVAKAPRTMDHTVYSPEPEGEASDDLWERIRGIHLVHDGMRNPQEVRRPTDLPQAHWPAPTLSGHGGELGHGFYYATKDKLRKLRRGRERAVIAQLERNARRRHSAATDEAYALYLGECERTLAEGRSYGLKGPVLLDWFYMAQRLPYRSGLGARSGRSSACVAPAFVRGAFDLRPKDRLTAKLHREVVARLVPEWAGVDFFSSDSEEMPEIHRARIWERPDEAKVLEEMIAAREGWPEMLVPERIDEMWREVRSGAGSADYEHVFYRLVWRAGYEEHLRLLASRL
jgi:hypothetical protein